jgi:hypothetical protein
MLNRVLPLVIVPIAVLATAFDARAQLSPDNQALLFNLHNQLRSQVALGQVAGQPPAANMARLVWDSGLAQTAQSWTDQCNFMHNPNLAGNAGENIFFDAAPLSASALQLGVNLWFAENSGYTFGPVSTTDLSHGHYTQVIWANTLRIGCGATFCPNLANGAPNSTFLVCDYAPPGNFIGQTPYISGPSCTQCPSGLGSCTSGLCVSPQLMVPALSGRAVWLLAILLLAVGAVIQLWQVWRAKVKAFGSAN